MKALIGVVGGMGPYAGVDLVKKIFDHTAARTDQEHLPVFLASLPHRIPDRTAFLTGQTDLNPAQPMTELLRLLNTAGATVAGVPCVTAHAPAIFDVVRQNLRDEGLHVRLLNILDETVRFIREQHPNVRSVAALSTTATFRYRLFLEPLAAAGFHVVEQTDDVQHQLVQDAIFNQTYGIKARSNPVTEQARHQLLDAVEHVADRGAEAVILGCTELPLALPEPTLGPVAFIDPTTVLARALIRESYPEKLSTLEYAAA